MSNISEKEKRGLAEAFSECEDDLIKYRHIMLENDEDIEVEPAYFHKDWSKSLLHGISNEVIQAFRESAKTQYVLRSFLLHALTYPRSETDYIVIIKKNTKLAGKKLKEIEDEYITNTVISGNLHKINSQSGEVFDVDVFDADGQIKNIRIEAYGKGASIRGLAYKDRRPKIIIIDDPQDAAEAFSETVQETDWDWFLQDVMFLAKKGRIFMIGNNLGDRCITERVIANKDDLKFNATRIPCADEGLTVAAWPEGLPIEKIRQEREAYRKLGKIDIWYRERMCQSIGKESQKCKKTDLRYYDPRKIEEIARECNVFFRTDLIPPPKEEQGKGDKAVCIAAGISSNNEWFVLDCVNERIDPSLFFAEVFKMVAKFDAMGARPINVGLPDGLESSTEHFLKVEMTKRKIYFDTILQKQTKQKELRIINGLMPVIKMHRLMLPMSASWLPEIENQLLRFPKGLFDDIIDALASVEQESFAPMKRVKAQNLPRGSAPDSPIL